MLNQSAVMVLYEKKTHSIILTKRSLQLTFHPGETCFPGGFWKPGDVDLWHTGLRELQEELGIYSNRIRLIEKLPLETTRSGIIIHPWLTSINTLEPYSVNEGEVAKVFKLPMKEINILSNYKDILLEKHGKFFTTCQFIASKHFIWGATARILKALCETNVKK